MDFDMELCHTTATLKLHFLNTANKRKTTVPLTGNFSPIGDKSISHRIALFSILAAGECHITNYSTGEDCQSSLNAFRRLGGTVCPGDTPGNLTLTGLEGCCKNRIITEINCGNSGTTIRILMGILSGMGKGNFHLVGDKYLSQRPMERVASPLRNMGADITTTADKPPVDIAAAPLKGIDFTMPVASAQLKSAILLAALRADGITRITEPVPSRNHTELMLKSFGADITYTDNVITILPGSIRLPEEFYVPSDPSSAAFFLTAATLIPGSDVTAEGILLNPTRTHFLKILQRMGADIIINEKSQVPEPWGDIRVRYNGPLRAADIKSEEIPLLVDEIPVLSLAASLAKGTSRFCGLNELRIKETDRVTAIKDELSAYGADISSEITEDNGDTLIIKGVEQLAPPEEAPDSRGDHRMSMTLRLAHVISNATNCIQQEACSAVSYPAFIADLGRLLS